MECRKLAVLAFVPEVKIVKVFKELVDTLPEQLQHTIVIYQDMEFYYGICMNEQCKNFREQTMHLKDIISTSSQ